MTNQELGDDLDMLGRRLDALTLKLADLPGRFSDGIANVMQGLGEDLEHAHRDASLTAAQLARIRAAIDDRQPDPDVDYLLRLDVPTHLRNRSAPTENEFIDMLGGAHTERQGSWGQSFTRATQTKGHHVLSTLDLIDRRTLIANLSADGAGPGRGSSLSQAFVRFPRTVPAASLSAEVTFLEPWDWGNPATGGSGKLFGLASHQSGWSPGGGNVGPDNFLVDVIWSGGHGPPNVSLYIYAQPDDQRELVGQTWEKAVGTTDANRGYLRQVAMPGFQPVPGESFNVTLTVNAAESTIGLILNGETIFGADVDLLAAAPAAEQVVTHLDFRPMYGGGPEAAPLVHRDTAIKIHDLRVLEVEQA